MARPVTRPDLYAVTARISERAMLELERRAAVRGVNVTAIARDILEDELRGPALTRGEPDLRFTRRGELLLRLILTRSNTPAVSALLLAQKDK